MPEEAPGGRRVPSLLEQHVDNCTVLVDGPPEVPVLTPDPEEDIVHEDRVSIASVTMPQPMGITGSELVAPEADRLMGDENAAPVQDILDVTVTQVEAVVEPDRMLDDLWRKPVPPDSTITNAVTESGPTLRPGAPFSGRAIRQPNGHHSRPLRYLSRRRAREVC